MRSLTKSLVLPLLVLASGAALAVPPPYDGVVSVDTIQVQPGNKFNLGVTLTNNNIGIAALSIPLKFASPELSLDSVSFIGSLLPASFTGTAIIDPSAHTVHVLYIPPFQNPIPTITDPSGLICRLFFSLSGNAQSGVVPIDSINLDSIVVMGPDTIHYWDQSNFSDDQGTAYFPAFSAGYVRVMVPTALGDDKGLLPEEFALGQNYPNPFNPSTVISYALPRASHVTLEVFNVLGQRVATLVDRRVDAGVHQVTFDASRQPSGVYFYRLTHDLGSETKKMILVK
ncbi:MAG: T9SS type A sorting domain-containing protein [Candidatus Zixiibacteriota bacterium]